MFKVDPIYFVSCSKGEISDLYTSNDSSVYTFCMNQWFSGRIHGWGQQQLPETEKFLNGCKKEYELSQKIFIYNGRNSLKTLDEGDILNKSENKKSLSRWQISRDVSFISNKHLSTMLEYTLAFYEKNIKKLLIIYNFFSCDNLFPEDILRILAKTYINLVRSYLYKIRKTFF
jgi:hypothetical protein